MKILHSGPTITDEDIQAVTEVLKSRHLEDGVVVEQFEEKMKDLIGREYAVATTNGFSAIHLTLIALNVKEQDEVIIPSYTCPALLNPVLLLHAKPVFADIATGSFNISYDTAKEKITSNTKAIIVPHTFGFPAEIEKIQSLGIPVIEDCAQSLGGRSGNKMLGNFTEASIFSFYATKMITTGDGGMILTDNREIYEIARNYRYYGHKRNHQQVAYNYHLTNLPAALGIAQSGRVHQWIEKRKSLARTYDHYFQQAEQTGIDFANRQESIYFRYPVYVENRDYLKEQLKVRDIYTGYGVLEGLHQLQEISDSEYPNTSQYLNHILSLPIYPSLEERDIERIAGEVLNILK